MPIPSNAQIMNDELNSVNFGVNYIYVGQKLWILEIYKLMLISQLVRSKSPNIPGRGVSENVSAVSLCLGSGLFGSCNSD